ncbi:OLC1v1020401C1 [Oldenlandia corymbosa var. corymbosa]|uniref:OLC1v1020401C1 n=1 Tax=Oldenlandia corymbosa var. corymbosa TaxID=529605 RepID=A0AAV1EGA5_OLDCO|nr:OLC1v1020401C1 [Oldenlandia corymbosa var. corymbosa]
MVSPVSAGIKLILISAATFFTIMLMSSPAVDGQTGAAHDLVGFYFPATSTVSGGSTCNGGGSIEECLMNQEEEMDDIDIGEDGLPEMESESSRRSLYYRRRYISYGALFRDRVPCSRRGYSYYNCRPGRHVNPYVRGCSAITRCRSF